MYIHQIYITHCNNYLYITQSLILLVLVVLFILFHDDIIPDRILGFDLVRGGTITFDSAGGFTCLPG